MCHHVSNVLYLVWVLLNKMLCSVLISHVHVVLFRSFLHLWFGNRNNNCLGVKTVDLSLSGFARASFVFPYFPAAGFL